MYFHKSLIPKDAYFLLPLESKQEATLGWTSKCISEVKVNQLKVKNIHVKIGISTFKTGFQRIQDPFIVTYLLYINNLTLQELNFALKMRKSMNF